MNFLSLLPFGIHVIILCLREVDSCRFLKQQLIALVTMTFNFVQETFRNLAVITSMLGDFIFFQNISNFFYS